MHSNNNPSLPQLRHQYSNGSTYSSTSQQQHSDLLAASLTDTGHHYPYSTGGGHSAQPRKPTKSEFYAMIERAAKNANNEELSQLIEGGVPGGLTDESSADSHQASPIDKKELNKALLIVVQNHVSSNKTANVQECIEILLHAGANVDTIEQQDKRTALMLACERGFIEIIDYLISSDASVNLKDCQQKTSIFHALEAPGENADVLAHLIKKGANVNQIDINGITPLLRATQKHYHQSMRILIEAGANVRHRSNNNSNTALHIACESGDFQAVEILMSLQGPPTYQKKGSSAANDHGGPDLDALNKDKETPLDIVRKAIERGQGDERHNQIYTYLKALWEDKEKQAHQAKEELVKQEELAEEREKKKVKQRQQQQASSKNTQQAKAAQNYTQVASHTHSHQAEESKAAPSHHHQAKEEPAQDTQRDQEMTDETYVYQKVGGGSAPEESKELGENPASNISFQMPLGLFPQGLTTDQSSVLTQQQQQLFQEQQLQMLSALFTHQAATPQNFPLSEAVFGGVNTYDNNQNYVAQQNLNQLFLALQSQQALSALQTSQMQGNAFQLPQLIQPTPPIVAQQQPQSQAQPQQQQQLAPTKNHAGNKASPQKPATQVNTQAASGKKTNAYLGNQQQPQYEQRQQHAASPQQHSSQSSNRKGAGERSSGTSQNTTVAAAASSSNNAFVGSFDTIIQFIPPTTSSASSANAANNSGSGASGNAQGGNKQGGSTYNQVGASQGAPGNASKQSNQGSGAGTTSGGGSAQRQGQNPHLAFPHGSDTASQGSSQAQQTAQSQAAAQAYPQFSNQQQQLLLQAAGASQASLNYGMAAAAGLYQQANPIAAALSAGKLTPQIAAQIINYPNPQLLLNQISSFSFNPLLASQFGAAPLGTAAATMLLSPQQQTQSANAVTATNAPQTAQQQPSPAPQVSASTSPSQQQQQAPIFVPSSTSRSQKPQASNSAPAAPPRSDSPMRDELDLSEPLQQSNFINEQRLFYTVKRLEEKEREFNALQQSHDRLSLENANYKQTLENAQKEIFKLQTALKTQSETELINIEAIKLQLQAENKDNLEKLSLQYTYEIKKVMEQADEMKRQLMKFHVMQQQVSRVLQQSFDERRPIKEDECEEVKKNLSVSSQILNQLLLNNNIEVNKQLPQPAPTPARGGGGTATFTPVDPYATVQKQPMQYVPQHLSSHGLQMQSNRLIHMMERFEQHSQEEINLDHNNIHNKLHLEILQFRDSVKEILAEMQPLKEQLIENITQVIQKALPHSQVKVYGSHATKLCLPWSDIDLVIITPHTHTQHHHSHYMRGGMMSPDNPKNVLGQINKELQQELQNKWVSQVTFVDNATVPVVKVNCHIKDLLQKHGGGSGGFTTTEYEKYRIFLDQPFNIDITQMTEFHNGLECVRLVQEFLAENEVIEPLILVLKQLLKASNLNNPYFGGLSSYALFLMIVSFLQSMDVPKELAKVNLGRILVQFLGFYGAFDQDNLGISCHLPASRRSHDHHHKANHYQLLNFMMVHNQVVQIDDPLNNHNNVGKSSFKFFEIKMAFDYAYRVFFLPCFCDCHNHQTAHPTSGSVIFEPSHKQIATSSSFGSHSSSHHQSMALRTGSGHLLGAGGSSMVDMIISQKRQCDSVLSRIIYSYKISENYFGPASPLQ